eukprot:4761823-Prymnesium_polylepis.1
MAEGSYLSRRVEDCCRRQDHFTCEGGPRKQLVQGLSCSARTRGGKGAIAMRWSAFGSFQPLVVDCKQDGQPLGMRAAPGRVHVGPRPAVTMKMTESSPPGDSSRPPIGPALSAIGLRGMHRATIER